MTANNHVSHFPLCGASRYAVGPLRGDAAVAYGSAPAECTTVADHHREDGSETEAKASGLNHDATTPLPAAGCAALPAGWAMGGRKFCADRSLQSVDAQARQNAF